MTTSEFVFSPHARFPMKKLLFLIFSFCLVQQAEAQLNCEPQLPMRVIAESGLNMRSKASLSSSVVVTVPYDSILQTCRKTDGKLVVDKITGYWRKAIYKGNVGYMFDGFLELAQTRVQKADSAEALTEKIEQSQEKPEKPEPVPAKPAKPLEMQFVTEAYNYCGDVSKLDPGLLWYGVYPADEKKREEFYQIQPVELNVVLSKAKIGDGMEFDIETEREERSIFLVGMNQLLDYKNLKIEDQSQRMRYTGRKVFPGQQMELGSDLRLSATGSVVKSGDCPEIKNYKLQLQGADFTQDLSKVIAEAECMPELYWYGDFSGDGIPEVILVSVSKEKNHFTLLSSENAESDQLLRPRAEWIIDNCY